MHSAAVHLAPIVAAEKSKVPFYIAGGVLVAWALIVSAGLGLRHSDFPGNQTGQRIVTAITAVLVLATVAAAVLTAGTPAKAGATGASATQPYSPPPPSPGAGAAGAPSPTTAPSPAAAGTGVSALKLAASASGQLSYDTKQLSGKAGTVTIALTNAAQLEHNLTIAQGTSVLGATPTFVGGSRTLTLKLKPGTYTFYCSVPGHRQGGMEGTLSVS